MSSTLFSALGRLTDSNISMVMLLVKATIILLVALGITLSMQRASAGARHLVWLVTVAALLLVPALTAWAPIPLRMLPADVSSARADGAASLASKSPGVGDAKTGDANFATPGAVADPSLLSGSIERSTPSTGLSGISILLLIWAAVLAVIAGSLAYAALVVRRIVNRARPLDTEDWLTPLWEVSDRLALDEPPRLLRSEDAKMPFACGLFTPTIVLPSECDGWSLDRRRAVLLHELAHVRRHDLVGHTMGRVACAVYWFHPLVWTAAKQLRSESERACDDLALSCGARATDYAEHLLDIVTSVRRDATPSVALAMARRKEFEGRMLAILDPELRHSSPSRRQSAALIGSLALISIVVGAAAPARRAHDEAPGSARTAFAQPAPVQNPVGKGYPDSREIIDGANMHTSTQTTTNKSQQTSTNISQHLSESISDHISVAVSSAIASSAAIASSSAIKTSGALIEMLTKGDAKKSGKASDERPALLAKILANDPDAKLRRIAAWGLAEYADGQVASDALAAALRRDSDPSVREMAAWALADADRSATAVDALVAALRGDANTRVRAISAWALGNVGGRSASIGEALGAALSDASVEVRKRAAWALGNADLKQAPPALTALLRDPNSEMRELAAWSLYQIEDPAAIPALDAALRAEPNKNLQIAYIRALAAIGERSVDALKNLLESKDPEIKAIAVRALAGGNATGPWPWPWPEPRPFPE
ncbi:MAG: HEAT repeat domain-containing protein [Gemmatimonadota bacterium]|nr:HEAT repeat domain-containing protein [Gemmatimonadota bacterium]